MDQLHARLDEPVLQRQITNFFELQYLGHEPRQVEIHLKKRIEVARVANVSQTCGLVHLAYALVGVGDWLPGSIIWGDSCRTHLKSSLQLLSLLVSNRCIFLKAGCLEQLVLTAILHHISIDDINFLLGF